MTSTDIDSKLIKFNYFLLSLSISSNKQYTLRAFNYNLIGKINGFIITLSK